MSIFSFPGGLKLKAYKRGSTDLPVQPAKIPKTLILPLQQHIGVAAQPVVEVGQKVYRGQLIARAGNRVSAPVHASSSGTVVAIEPRPTPHASGLDHLCIVIETDGLDQSRRKQERVVYYKDLSVEEVRRAISNAGIVGMGGAGFPAFIKLSSEKPVDTLILNGAECEPYITCDDMLMQEQAPAILEGLEIMQYAVNAKHCIIAIESNKPLAIKRMTQALKNSKHENMEVITIPTIYPTGGEKQLILTLTGKEVPSQGIPLDIGLLCANVGTAYAVSQALYHGEPLISRYVTVNGAVSKARNLEVRIGTPMGDIIEQCGGNRKTLSRLIMGGPMMGIAMHSDMAPVIKTTNCIVATSVVSDVPLPSREQTSTLPCIRCGACVSACPMGLLPHQLYWYARAKDMDKVQDYHLFDCIECGCCDYVCPSHLPLVQYYRFAKSTIWRQEREKQISDKSRERHEFHQFRLAREKAEKEARHKKKREALQSKNPELDKKKALIQAAVERARAKREAVKPKNTENLTPEQQRLIEEVENRRSKQQ